MTAGAASVREERRVASPFALFEHREWQERFPGLAAGITAAAREADFGIGTAESPLAFFERYRGLASQLGFGTAVLARQVHGARIVRATEPLAPDGERGPPPEEGGPRFFLPGRADGLLTDRAGVLLAVTAADCVPVYLVEPVERVAGLLHAGWRGIAAGILERGVAGLRLGWGIEPSRLFLHLGPAICGDCYEVGPEVAGALGLPATVSRVDLRGLLLERGLAEGLEAGRISLSAWCTRCRRDHFHSHRGSEGRAGRMAAYVGWREEV